MTADLYQIPMFPLGRVALPGETVSLRIFEPRYLEMVRAVEAGSGEFGIVLISRGWEVGGGDDRCGVATVTRVVRDVPVGDGQRAVVVLASRRITIIEWLADDPFPAAMVVDLVDTPPAAEQDIAPLRQRVRRLFALASELGADTGSLDVDKVESSSAGLWRLASLVPLAEFDRQRLIETTSIDMRTALLAELVDDAIEELTLRLGAGG